MIAYPIFKKWIADRCVKKDVYDVINYINERKSEIQSGEYGMHQVALNTRVHTYSMSTKNYFNTYKKVGSNNYFKNNRVCLLFFRHSMIDFSNLLEIHSSDFRFSLRKSIADKLGRVASPYRSLI